MNPIAAVGFAASIITFVDFALELVSGASELYKSPTGRTAKNTHIENVINDLQDVADDLNIDSLGNSKEAKRLRRLASNCNELAEELLSVLKLLKIEGSQNRPWKSLVAMWRNMRKADETNSMEERLREYRSEMMLELSLMISNQQSSVCANLETMKAEAVQLKSQTGRDLDSIRDQILMNTEQINKSSSISSEKHADILQLLQQLQKAKSMIPVQHRILRQLMYGSMHFREESIHDAETGTCKWILEGINETPEPERIADKVYDLRESKKNESLADKLGKLNLNKSTADANESPPNIDHNMSQQPGEDVKVSDLVNEPLTKKRSENEMDQKYLYQRSQDLQKTARAQFRLWLRSGTGIFHICGKPGSGKSTLIKYVQSHPRTRCELEKWAGCKKLVLAYFYFSNNTRDESQMSLDSLYRSILFECLSQYPELISEVFPQQWRNFNALNEYQGDTYDHWKFAKMLRDWSSGNDLKICASSRPHTEYLDTFCPPYHVRILLQDLNAYDIYLFSRQLLQSDERFSQIRDVYLDLAVQLSERSEGVFLWAVFAARMLLTSLGYGDDPRTLAKNLDILPEQLDALYEKLLGSVSKHNRNQCDKFLCLTLMNPFNKPLTAVSYSWVNDLGDPGFPPPDVGPYNEDEIMCREKSVERQLDKLTKGLLEIVETRMIISKILKISKGRFSCPYETQAWKSVQFLHRTFREFLQESSQQNSFLQNFPGSTPGEIYGKMRLAEISYRCPSNLVQDIGLRGVFVANGMYMLSPERDQTSNKLWGLPLALTKRFMLICQETRFRACCSYSLCQNLVTSQAENASFIHLAAASGHKEYILNHLENDASLLNQENGDLSLEISALNGGHTCLASEFLGKGGSMYQQISLHRTSPRLDNQISDARTAPIWMAAVYLAMQFEFGSAYQDNKDWRLQAIRLWEFIQQHVLTSINAKEWWCQVVIISETKTCITLGTLLQMLAEQYSLPDTSSYMNQECWQTLRRMLASAVQPSDYNSPQPPCQLMPADGSKLLSALKCGTWERFEVKFGDYVINDEWCFRIW